MDDLTPGVRRVTRVAVLAGAEEAAVRAVALAAESAGQGSFGVGGLLADRDGRVVAEANNAVILNGRLRDPTAHVERQLVDWYFRQNTRSVPAREDLVIVTSLDPCAMCAGAILRSGLSAIAIAADPISGVSENGIACRLPRELWERAARHLAFFGIKGKRRRCGADLGPLFAGEVSSTILTDAEAVFSASVDKARAKVGGAGAAEPQPALEYEPRARDLSILAAALSRGAMIPRRDLRVSRLADLGDVMELLSGDRAALIDRRGRLIMTKTGARNRSPARSSVLELIRAYAGLRRAAATGGVALPHQRFCSIVKRRPSREPDEALLELGAIGSFLEERRPPSDFPALSFLEWNSGADVIRNCAASMPPLYTDVIGVTVGPVPGIGLGGA